MELLSVREYELSEIEEVSASMLQLCKKGSLVGFSGDLGAGKTTLIRSLVSLLGGTEPVSSPTYVLQHIYTGKDFPIHHWDLYRVTSTPEELVEMQGECLTLIEWPEKDPGPPPKLDALITLQLLEESTRKITAEIRS